MHSSLGTKLSERGFFNDNWDSEKRVKTVYKGKKYNKIIELKIVVNRDQK